MEKNIKIIDGLMRFHLNFQKEGNVYLEDSVLWYCIDMGISRYLSLKINDRINFKQSYFNIACK